MNKRATSLILSLLLLANCASGDNVPGSDLAADHIESQLYARGEQVEVQWDAVELYMQTCMKAEGFAYERLPYLDPDGRASLSVPTLGSWTPDLAEHVGFGVVDFPELQENPNRERVEAMSAASADQWQTAYFGKCRPAADESVFGAWAISAEPLRADFRDLVSEFNADERIVRLQSRWSECMLSSGYSEHVSSFDALVSSFVARMEDFSHRVRSAEPSDAERAELDQLKEEERRVAVDAVACAEPLKFEFSTIWNAFQADFLLRVEIPAFDP